MCRMAKDTKKNRQALSGSKTQQVNVALISLKLIIACGLPEGIGLINIQQESLSENEHIVNAFFGFLYIILKGFRGVILLVVYVCRKYVIDMYKNTSIVKKLTIPKNNVEDRSVGRISTQIETTAI